MINKIILISVLSFVFAVCASLKKNETQQDVITDEITISGATWIKSDTAVNLSLKKETNNPKDVSGSVVFTNSYCGGVRPSQETLDECNKEFPLVNSTILLKNANVKSKAFKIAIDDKGKFNKPLEVGTYNYFMTTSYSKTIGCAFNSTCEIWLKRSFGQITIVEGQTEGYKITYNFGCNPCEPKRP